jgi:hypothetical protein
MITENSGLSQWAKLITEEYGVEDKSKLSWVAQYAQNHEIYEAGPTGVLNGQAISGVVNPLMATPLNTMGMGNPAVPSNPTTTNPADFFNQTNGSGDIPMSTLPMALNIALTTVGLELVPVIPSKGPWTILSYMDFPYGGGKLGAINETAFDGVGTGAENKPIYIRVDGSDTVLAAIKAAADTHTEKMYVTITSDGGVLKGIYKGFSRMDGCLILQVVSCMKDTADVSISTVFRSYGTTAKIKIGTTDGGTEVYTETVIGDTTNPAKPDFVETLSDFMDGFANFATGEKEAMTRAQNETGTGNVIGLRLVTKLVTMGSYEVTGTVTRQQLQDLPLYGVDAQAKLMEVLQNEISQSINARILEQVFRLGVSNAVQQKRINKTDLNLHMGTAATTMAATQAKEYKDIMGVDHKATWGTITNSEVNTSAENLSTRQRRIMSRVLAASNLIQTIGRRGRATFIVTNAQVATALQDCAGYIIAPMTNTMVQDGSQNLFLAGSVAGLQVYVDPYMDWNDTRICVGRKGDGNSPGLVFMPYILADTVSITAENTMAPKFLVNSRYALVPAGYYPELMYYTLVVDSPEFGII